MVILISNFKSQISNSLKKLARAKRPAKTHFRPFSPTISNLKSQIPPSASGFHISLHDTLEDLSIS
jgi:hypothetical protein